MCYLTSKHNLECKEKHTSYVPPSISDSQIPLSTIELLAFEHDSALAALSNMFILDIISWLILTPQRLLPAERLP